MQAWKQIQLRFKYCFHCYTCRNLLLLASADYFSFNYFPLVRFTQGLHCHLRHMNYVATAL